MSHSIFVVVNPSQQLDEQGRHGELRLVGWTAGCDPQDCSSEEHQVCGPELQAREWHLGTCGGWLDLKGELKWGA